MNRASRCIRTMTILAAAAITVAGCADSRMAASNTASSPAAGVQASAGTAQVQRSTSAPAGNGLNGSGFTTDLYTEFFRSNKRDDKTPPTNDNSAPASVAGPVVSGPVVAGPAVAGPVVAGPVASNTVPQGQPAFAQPAAAAPEAPPAQSTVYGISSNGTTTDLYTELFGPRRRE